MSEYKRITDTTKDESPSSSSLQDVSETGDDEIMTSDYNNEPVPPQRQAIPKAAAIGSSYSSSRTEHPLIQQQYSGNDIISPPRSDFSFIAKEDQNVLSPNDSTENMMYLIKRPEFHHQINGPFLPTIEGNSTSNNTSAKKLARLSNINNQQRRSRIGQVRERERKLAIIY